MADFSHLNKLRVSSERLVDYPLYQLEGEPVLHLSPASESNKGYFNALLRKAGKSARAVKNNKLNVHIVKENRDEDRVLFAKHVVKGWSGVTDSSGKHVEFAEGEALGFLSSLPDWIFDEIRTFASDIQNFIEAPLDVEEKAKNLQSD
jgi:hypothetical protein